MQIVRADIFIESLTVPIFSVGPGEQEQQREARVGVSIKMAENI